MLDTLANKILFGTFGIFNFILIVKGKLLLYLQNYKIEGGQESYDASTKYMAEYHTSLFLSTIMQR